ncbi:hypothetical protein Dsin_016960 [Dipteronia sinensis]|uniref:Uncharacterized protein n=1 Tax=Dipteronia sinensis TaxID=43782 RepID=A0AAE0E638_9ROSI|nr:hypothetical protein Dsin_016960 [Dipteronia sinensis]
MVRDHITLTSRLGEIKNGNVGGLLVGYSAIANHIHEMEHTIYIVEETDNIMYCKAIII